jgi:hypothetical protein
VHKRSSSLWPNFQRLVSFTHCSEFVPSLVSIVADIAHGPRLTLKFQSHGESSFYSCPTGNFSQRILPDFHDWPPCLHELDGAKRDQVYAPPLVSALPYTFKRSPTFEQTLIIGALCIQPLPPTGSGPRRYALLLSSQSAGFAVPPSFTIIDPPTNSSSRIAYNITEFIPAVGLSSLIIANNLRVLNGTANKANSITLGVPLATASVTQRGIPPGLQLKAF